MPRQQLSPFSPRLYRKTKNNTVAICHFFFLFHYLHCTKATVTVTKRILGATFTSLKLTFVHCTSISTLPIILPSPFFFLFFSKSETPGSKKPLWALILYLSTAATMSGCPGRTRGFISNLQSDTGERPPDLHMWWDTCTSGALRGASPTARPHTVRKTATTLFSVSISGTSRCNCMWVNTRRKHVFCSLVSMSAKARYDSFSKAAGRRGCWE